MTDRNLKILGIVLLSLFTLAFAYVGLFAHPYADDFGFASGPHATWLETKSLGAVLASAIDQSKEMYYTWQGSFGSIFLFGLNPIVFNYEWYWVGSVFLVLLYTFSNFCFSYQVFHKYFRFPKSKAVGLSAMLVCLLYFSHFSIHEFFYNYISGMYYNFFNAFALFGFAILLSASFKPSLLQTIFLCILFFIIGSGNYITAILCFTALVLQILYFSVKKEYKHILSLAIITFFLLLSLSISVIAPGNAVRQASMDPSLAMPPIKAIAFSFVEAFKILIKMLDIKVLFFLVLLFLVPFPKMQGSIHPIYIFVLCLILCACQFTPILYAQGNAGPDRIYALIYSNTTMLFYFCLLYSFLYYKESLTRYRKGIVPIVLVLGIAITMIFPPKWNLKYIFADINSGTLQAYHTEKIQRHRFLQTAQPKGLIDVIPIKNTPQSMELGELLDPNSWVNQSFAKYYQIEGIHLKLN